MFADDPSFWLGLLEIIGVNIILSGDNAIVIALAARSLPPRQQKWGIALGAAGAIVLRVICTIFVVYLLAIPYLKIGGGLLLLWIAVKLLLPEKRGSDEIDGKATLVAAVRTILIADTVMSLDNVIGIAAAANGDLVLLVLGLLISMPLVIFGSALLLKLFTRFPIIVTLGGALLGYIGGQLLVTDAVVQEWVTNDYPLLHNIAAAAGAVGVVLAGKLLSGRMSSTEIAHPQPDAASDK
jgi:YjbE family integral membrane protein